MKRKKKAVWMLLLCICFVCAPVRAKAEELNSAGQEQTDSVFTEEEQEIIRSIGTLKVGYVADRLPVSFCNEETGELDGISRRIFDRIQELTGLKMEYVALPGGSVTYDYLRGEKFDLVSSVEYNEANKHSRGILISDPYLKSKKVIVGRPGLMADPENGRDGKMKVALSTGSQTLKGVLLEQYPDFELVDYDTIDDCFEAVRKGEADLLIQNQYVVEYWRARARYDSLLVIPVAGLDDMLCFSAVTPIEPAGEEEKQELAQKATLISILDKAIAQMSEDEITTYVISATMENQYNFELGDFLYEYRYSILVFGVISVLAVCLAAASIIFYMKTVKAQAQAKAKGDFLSAMSHEIRTPLNGMLGLNQVMLHHLDDSDRLQECLQQSSLTAKYLLTLVNDILDMSKLQENNLPIENAMFSLSQTVQSVEAIEQARMGEKGLKLQVEADIPHPFLMGDETHIQQIILNITDNAYKFTPAGGTVTLKVSQQPAEEGWVSNCISVTDTGCGMSEALRKKIFDSFTREPGAVSKGNQGTGLGMAISYRLAKLMGGELSVESAPDRGSCFTFVFPAQMSQEFPVNPPKEGMQGRILVAEDNELNAEILRELLQDAGYEVDIAQDGQVALDMFRASEDGWYSHILMDLLMPVKDGYQTAREIRRMSRADAESVKIIACTANALNEDRSRAIASGMDGFVAKPIDMKTLLRALQQ